MKIVIPVENGDLLAALQGFLHRLFDRGVVEALLVPMRTPGGAISPALVSNPDLLTEADPLAPVMPCNTSVLVGKLSVRKPRAKVGVVMRSCEIRALIELVKLQQANLDDVVLVALDCAGTYDVPVFQALRDGGKENLWADLFRTASTDPASPDPRLRLACRMCEQPVYDNANINVELMGSDLDSGVNLSLPDELAEELGFTAAESSGRAEAVERLIKTRIETRDAEFVAIRKRLESEEGIIGVFDACIRCHNCMTVCPTCYCKTCVFKSNVFDHEPMRYVGWANQKGALRLPADISLFHLTRLNHMGLSCVGCGMCTQACPADLPVGAVFRAIGQRLQETFEYSPGRDVDETLPLITFKEDEWIEIAE